MDVVALFRSLQDPLSEVDAAVALTLSPEEVTKAREIKVAAQAWPNTLQPLSDFEYVQYALCTEGETMDKIMQRMEVMEAFRQEYSIQDTKEEGVELLSQLMQEHPEFVLSLDYVTCSKNFLTIFDLSKLIMARIRTQEQFRIFMGAMYYMVHCKQCQFTAIRVGSSVLCECMGTTAKNIDHGVFDKLLHELYRWYPKKQKEMFFLHTPSVVNVLCSLWKRFMTSNQKQSLWLNKEISGMEGQSINTLYTMPTPERATRHVLSMTQRFLETRYRNEREFRLPVSSTAIGELA